MAKSFPIGACLWVPLCEPEGGQHLVSLFQYLQPSLELVVGPELCGESAVTLSDSFACTSLEEKQPMLGVDLDIGVSP